MVHFTNKRVAGIFCLLAVLFTPFAQTNNSNNCNIEQCPTSNLNIDTNDDNETWVDENNDTWHLCEMAPEKTGDASSNEPKSLHQEIIDELEHIRDTKPQLQWDLFYHKPFEKYYQNRMEEAQILDSVSHTEDFWKTYATFKISAMLGQLQIDMVLLTPTIAPKTYALVESVAQKMGFQHIPYIYLASDKYFFNAAAIGFTPSTSIVLLGEELVKQTLNTQALEFIIAHELSHAQNYHIAKISALRLGISAACMVYNSYRFESTAKMSYLEALKAGYNNFTLKNLAIDASINLGSALLVQWFTRLCEWDADMTAASAVGTQGGIEFFNLLKQKEADDAKFYRNTYILNDTEVSEEEYYAAHPNSMSKNAALSIKAFFETKILPFFMTHPSHDERIDYLTNLQKRQETHKLLTDKSPA